MRQPIDWEPLRRCTVAAGLAVAAVLLTAGALLLLPLLCLAGAFLGGPEPEPVDRPTG